ncbi:unnamed protein product [Sphagnum troendelagicum]
MGDQEFVDVLSVPAVVDSAMTDPVVVTVEETYKVAVAAAEHEDVGNENGNGDSSVAVVDEQVAVEEMPVPTTEEDRLWAIVKENAADFNAWTALIQETEKLDNILKIQAAYDTFLAEFPLCYGYWKKYADHEARLGTPEKIVEVYERAVKAVTYSVDIWMHFCTYAMEKFDDPEKTRRLFERGLTFVGTDYLSHLLWDKYIDFEYSQQEWSRLSQIYTRILQIPLNQLDRYYHSFKQIANSRPLSELRSPEEAKAAAEEAVPVAEDATLADDTDEPPKPEKVGGLTEAEELEKYLAIREALYRKAKEWDSRIRDFETAIRRPYFHVKPLDDMQLGNWHRYLDFIEKEGDLDRTVKLYERCLIACANYPEYWIRYVQRMEVEGNLDLANNALTRATTVFVKRRPEVHLFAARFREQEGDVKGARSAYEVLSSELAPGLLGATVKHANFEHRQGNIEAACSAYEAALQLEKAKEESRAFPILSIQYARFLDQVVGNTERAQEIYTAALEFLPTSKVLWEAAIYFETLHKPGEKQVQFVDALVEQAIAATRPDGSPGLSASDREEISTIFLEFVDLFGDVQAIKKAEARHRQFFPSRRATVESKKRPSPESALTDRAKVHKPYVAVAAGPALAGPPVYANGQAQWGAASYGQQTGYAQQQQPQTWQQPPPQQPAPPVQPQQWNQGYAPHQGGYGGYGGYAAYGPPQQQAPPPQQQAAYGGYGQGYPPQAYPQTAAGYGQEAAYRPPLPSTATPQPQAQAAQAQAAYYGSYY